jgi:adenylate cyclase
LGIVYLFKKQHEQAIVEAERAIALDPNNAASYAYLGWILSWAGRPEEAIGLVQKAMRLNPRYPFGYLYFLGHAYHLTGRYEEAMAVLKRAVIRNPDHLPIHRVLACIYSDLDREEEARAEVAAMLKISPNFSLDAARGAPFKDPAVLERHLAALRKAGLK